MRSTVRRSTVRAKAPTGRGRDFVWWMTAITWGFGVEETAEQLIEESGKARANGQAYADLTAKNAARSPWNGDAGSHDSRRRNTGRG